MTDYKLTELIIEYSDSEDERADNEPDLTEYKHVSHGIRFNYYVGYEITSLVGYKNPKSTISKNVSKFNQIPFREYPGVKNPPLDPRTILITR